VGNIARVTGVFAATSGSHTWFGSKHMCVYIQSDSAGKVNVLRADSIGHCDQKVRMNTCLILNGY
jgi:hypothetical protein